MKLICVIFVLLLALMTSAQCQQTAEDWINKGDDFSDKGFYDLAITCYDDAIRLDPNLAAAWNNKGFALYNQGKYDEAIKYYNEAIRLDLNYSDAWSNKGFALNNLGKYDEALKAFDAVIKLDPNNALAWVNKWSVLNNQGKYDEAIQAYDEAIRLDPNYASAWDNKGIALNAIMRVVKSSDRLSSYSIKSSVTQTLKLNSGANATSEKLTTVTESAENVAVVNLSSLEAHASGSTKNQMEMPDQPANTSTTSADVYQIGNSTYVNDESGNWTHLVDPRSKQEVWGQDKNNQVKAIAQTLNLSTTEDLGSETVNGEEAYKLKIVIGSRDYINLYNAAFAVAAKITQYPMYLPSVNRSELNDTAAIDKTIWISKKSYLPIKFHSLMSFKMTPEIIGALDTNTGQTNMFNQSIRLGEISVSIETSDLYYDFDKPVKITLPKEAAAVWTNNGLAFSAQGKYEKAIPALGKAIEINPKDAVAWNGIGYALSAQGKYDEALAAFDKAIEIDPQFAVAWQNKGEVLMKLNRSTEANDTFVKVMEMV